MTKQDINTRASQLVNNHNTDVFIAEFFRYMPNRLGWAYDNNLCDVSKDLCNKLDYVEFHYRRYLAGTHKTLHRTFCEIRKLLDDAYAPEILLQLITDIKNVLLENEFYEIMPRWEKSFKAINKLIDFYWEGMEE